MPSNKETLFQAHICQFLETEHGYQALDKTLLPNQTDHIIEPLLLAFIKNTQAEKYAELVRDYHSDAEQEIIKALKNALKQQSLWLIMRNKLDVKGIKFELYKPKPRSKTSSQAEQNYQHNQFHYKKEYAYNSKTQERIDLVIWLNGLPIIVIELKHEDEGQAVDDAIIDSFLKRDLNNQLYSLPFLYIAASNIDVKIATNPRSNKQFSWFNAQVLNKAETKGEYPVEHCYRYALSKESIVKYLEHYLVFVPAKQKIDEDGVLHSQPSFTIFPRYHQLRASQKLANDVKANVNQQQQLGLKYLINHSAGSGKTLTIAWMADQLDSLYDDKNQKVFDNIVILTDRKSLDKNIQDDLNNFVHLKNKVNIAKKSKDLAKHLENNRDIIVSTIQKFGYIQDKLTSDENLKSRKIAFLIDEAHRSQEGKMALKMRTFFTVDGQEYEQEEDEPSNDEDIADKLKSLDISNQVLVAFTATTTPKTVAYFGEPFDIYREEEAIAEGYILDVAQHIISYQTLYHLRLTQAIPDNEFPAGVLAQALNVLAFNDDALIQYKSEVIVKLFIEQVADTLKGKGKAMVVASSRPAGLKFYNTIKLILEKKALPYKVLFAFSDYNDPITNESIEEVKVNQLGNTLIEDFFDTNEYRFLVVANKFQTGFDQPLLTAMFLDKAVKEINAIQTISRLNRKHVDKEQDDILVVDFTNSTKNIFNAFNQHRKGSPYKEKEPDKSALDEVYQAAIDTEVFSPADISRYVKAYGEAEDAAKLRESELDALLSNINQDYKAQFSSFYSEADDRKAYIALLNRYIKLYYFIAQFFELEQSLHEFIVFAEVMANCLVKKGNTSELKLLLKHIEVSKGAVTYIGKSKNDNKPTTTSTAGGNTGGNGIPKTTIEKAIEEIEQKYKISKEEAIFIREICAEVSKIEEIKIKVTDNKNNILFLRSYEPTVQGKVTDNYIGRELWAQLDDPIYKDQGGIFSIMSRTVIDNIIFARAA
jgi:type I restriction enzyme R subunit